LDSPPHDYARIRPEGRHQTIQTSTRHCQNAKWLQGLGGKAMKVKELIAQLQECNPELEVYTWNDHDIHAITMVDEIDEWVHLNLGEKQ